MPFSFITGQNTISCFLYLVGIPAILVFLSPASQTSYLVFFIKRHNTVSHFLPFVVQTHILQFLRRALRMKAALYNKSLAYGGRDLRPNLVPVDAFVKGNARCRITCCIRSLLCMYVCCSWCGWTCASTGGF